jgi:outer membrane protein
LENKMSTAPAQAPASRFRALPSRFLKRTLGVAVLSLLAVPVLAEDLLQVFNLAVENDPVIREARANYNALHTRVDQGRALLLPSVNLQASRARNTRGVDGGGGCVPGALFCQPEHDFGNGFPTESYFVNLQQAVLNFNAWYQYKSMRKTDESAALSLARSEQDLIMRVATAYFDVLRAQSNLASAEAREAAATQLLEQTQQRFDVGLIPITDVNNTQATNDRAVVERLRAENALNQAFEALEAITGVDYSNVSELSPEFPITNSDTPLEQWTATTMESNLALQIAQTDLEARQEDARAARAAMFPTLSLGMNYNWNKSGNTVSLDTPNLGNISTGIQLTFAMPLFQGGRLRAAQRQAYYTRDAAEETVLRVRRQSTQDISNNFRNVETDVRAVAAQAQAIVSAQSSLEANTVGAEVGTRNIVDVTNAQEVLFAAQRDHANARFDYVMDTLRLKQSAGVLSPQDVIDLNQWLVE